MKTFGETIRELRKLKKVPLRVVAAYLDIDSAIMSKIETGNRRATRLQAEKLAKFFGRDKKQILITWLGDRIAYEIANEEFAPAALKVAEEHIRYLSTPKLPLSKIKKTVSKEFARYKSVVKVWIFGSFARAEDNYNSDIDLMVDVPSRDNFSLFDLFEIQHNLEQVFKRKVDLVMKGAMKPFAWETAKDDLKLIYDRSGGKE